MKIVLCNGCFDLLHVGHVRHLREAKAMGDYLVVALTLDEHVNKGPGRPIYKWCDRHDILAELDCVDAVFPSARAIDAIRAVRPHVFVKGIEYKNGDIWAEDIVKVCEEVGCEIRFTKAEKLTSTTETIAKILNVRV